MSNPSKKRGTAAEVALLLWLHHNGHPEAVRNPPGGRVDVGDLRCEEPEMNMPVVIEVKSVKDLARGIAEGLAELDVEKSNAGAEHGVLVVKRRGVADPGGWLAIRRVADDPELGPA